MRLSVLAAFTVAFAVGCSSSSSGEKTTPVAGEAGPGSVDAGPPAPTFTNVMKFVITRSACGGPACHATALNGFTLGLGSISPASVYAQLVNKAATGPLCAAGSVISGGDAGADAGDAGPLKVQPEHLRVIPGDPDNSLLYQKLTGSPPCGDAMPKGGIPDADNIQLVHDWIAAGAKQD